MIAGAGWAVGRSGGDQWDGRGLVVGSDPLEELVEVVSGEAPVEWSGDGIVAVLEGGQALGDLVGVGEVVGVDDLALHDGEVDLALVEPGGVAGQVGLRDASEGLMRTVPVRLWRIWFLTPTGSATPWPLGRCLLRGWIARQLARLLCSDRSHPAKPRSKCAVQRSHSSAGQSKVAHHSTNARFPSVTGVTRIVAV